MSAFKQPQLLDSHELLSTKLALPRLKSPWVPRPRLLERLDAGLEQKVTLISAPAGFGKTTLVTEWAYKLQGVAWVSLDSGDNDPIRFWRYVLNACQAFGEGIGSSAIAILHASQEPSLEAMLTRLINDLAQLPGKKVLVLEDYHLITSQKIHETLAFLIEHLPSTLHLVLMTRIDPPLPLARLRARNDLAELRATELRFTQPEIEAFIQQAIPYTLPEEAVRRLAERTEGWAAGMRLVSLAFQGRQEPAQIEQVLDAITGARRPVLEYLVLEVLGAQPEPLQAFLLQTSFLSRLTASLCDTVTGHKDSATILEQIEQANLFLVPLDASGQWYRYHALFAEAMQHVARDRLGEDHLCELYQRASLWYEEHGLLAEAVEAALSAQLYPRAADLIDRIIAPRLVQNEHHTLRCWIDQIPKQVLYTYPTICFTYATAILFTSDRFSPETHKLLQEPLRVAEEAWRESGNRHKLGGLLAFRSVAAWVQGNPALAISAAHQALELLPEDDLQWRGISLIFVASEQELAGKLHAARQTLVEARSMCMSAGNPYGTLDTTNMLAEVSAMQGELQQAAQLFRWAISELERSPMDRDQGLLRRGRALAGLAALALECNDLKAAEEQLSQAQALGQEAGNEVLSVHSALVQARLLHACGEVDPARELLGALALGTQDPELVGEVLTTQAWMNLASGDLTAVQHWLTIRPDPDAKPLLQREQEDLIVARLSIAQGKAGEALTILEGLLSSANADGRFKNELEARILMALAYSTLDDRMQARQALVQALEMGQPEGFKRTFLDHGEALRVLIFECRPLIKISGQDELLAYTDSLLEAYEKGASADHPPTSQQRSMGVSASKTGRLVEPLSEREERVLKLLAAGLSNPEIAQELVISVNTVKTHIKSIYRKLDVNNRKEVRQVARRLKLD